MALLTRLSAQPEKCFPYGTDPPFNGKDPLTPARAHFEMRVVISDEGSNCETSP